MYRKASRTMLGRMIFFAATALAACASTPPEIGALVWSDEFDGMSLDASKWALDDHRNRLGWYNDEAQYYGLNNAEVADGVLRITAKRERAEGAADYGGQTYTSARLHTKGLYALRYGSVEARIKVPCGRGLWPAFWMLPEGDHGWPGGGEIDIMEYVGWQPDTFHATVHTKSFNHMDGTEVGEKAERADACDAWHVHRLDWGPDALTVSLDGERYFTFENDGTGEAAWPFDKPFHLLLNMAVGGTWGGRQGIDDDVFPATMEVDWVRVYSPT